MIKNLGHRAISMRVFKYTPPQYNKFDTPTLAAGAPAWGLQQADQE
jgi:hypothetical protein